MQVKELKLLCKAHRLTQVGSKLTLQMKLAVKGIRAQMVPDPEPIAGDLVSQMKHRVMVRGCPLTTRMSREGWNSAPSISWLPSCIEPRCISWA